MLKLVPSPDNLTRKKFSYWIKKSSNDPMFLAKTQQEIGTGMDEPIQGYVSYKVKQIISR